MKFILFLCILIVSLVSCKATDERIQLSCSEIRNLIPQNLIEVSKTDFVESVKTEYNLDNDNVIVGEYDDPRITFTSQIKWQLMATLYRAEFKEDQLLLLKTELLRDIISAESIVQCFGEPEFYLSYQSLSGETGLLILELWYPQQGWIFRGEQNVDWRTLAKVSPTMEMNYIYITQPGYTEEVAERTSPTSTNINTRLHLLHQWAGSFQNIEVIQLDSSILPP